MQTPVCRRQRNDVKKRGAEKCAFKSCKVTSYKNFKIPKCLSKIKAYHVSKVCFKNEPERPDKCCALSAHFLQSLRTFTFLQKNTCTFQNLFKILKELSNVSPGDNLGMKRGPLLWSIANKLIVQMMQKKCASDAKKSKTGKW